MKQLLKGTAASIALLMAASAQAAFTGDVTGGGLFSDNVDTDNGWLIEAPVSNGVDFWTITAAANTTLSVDISSSIDFGISIYQGAVDDDLGFAFDNDGDFNGGTYIGGTDGLFSDGSSSLNNLLLTDAGVYTIAVGGDSGFGGFGGPYSYNMSVNASAVPVPAAAWLFGSAVLGLFGMRRNK